VTGEARLVDCPPGTCGGGGCGFVGSGSGLCGDGCVECLAQKQREQIRSLVWRHVGDYPTLPRIANLKDGVVPDHVGHPPRIDYHQRVFGFLGRLRRDGWLQVCAKSRGVVDQVVQFLHQRGMVDAIGMARGSSGGSGGDRLAKFVAGDRLKPFINQHLAVVTGQLPVDTGAVPQTNARGKAPRGGLSE